MSVATPETMPFRTVDVNNYPITVQTGPVSKRYALDHVDEHGNYTAVLALDPYFYADAVHSSNGVDTLYDQLAADLTEDFVPYGMSEKIIGFDHESNMVLVEVTNDVIQAAQAAGDDDDTCAEDDCDASLDDGEGYDGYCGNHADQREAAGVYDGEGNHAA